MSDRLYLSCRLRGFNDRNALRHFEKLLGIFPFSKLAKRGPVLRVHAVAMIEPPVLEREFELGTPPADVIARAREFFQPDCCAEADGSWDLWQFDGEWKLRPAAVTFACFGSQFEQPDDDHLQIEFGLDALFLPNAAIEGSLRMHQSNLKSLLRLVADIEQALPLESRRLWSESGTNFAGMLAETLGRFNAN